MSIEWIGVLAILVGLLGLLRGEGFAVRFLVPSTLLASAAAFRLTALGGMGVQPAYCLLAFLIASSALKPRAFARVASGAAFPSAGFWLAATAAYGMAGALLLPRLFAGSTETNAIGESAYGMSIYAVPLGPSSGNLTQPLYFCADVLCFLVVYRLATEAEGFANLVRGALLYAIGNIVFAVADLATFWTHTGYLMDALRNGNYAMHDDTVVLGWKRVVGSFTEASSFASASCAVLGFALPLFLRGAFARRALIIAIAAIVGLLLSTSSTAYISLPALLGVIYLGELRRFLRAPVRANAALFLALSPLLALAAVLLLALLPAAWSQVERLADVLVFQKTASESAIDRVAWNVTALKNFVDSWGFGVGVGSARASSFPIAALANLGVPGTLTYAAFIAVSLLGGPPDDLLPANVAAIRAAARGACFGLLIAATVSGALIDLGLPFFIFAALACAAGGYALPRQIPAPARLQLSVNAA